jgi:predicted phosphodiesterase
MRLAIFSDIHGNSIALDAVLGDIEARGGVDQYWVLGDIIALGPDPIGVLERLTAIENVHFVRGNTDRYVLTGDRPPPSLEQALENPDQVSILAVVAAGFAWTQGYLQGAGWFDWLKTLPLEQRLTLPDGTRLLGIHAAPKHDERPSIHPNSSDEALQTAYKGCDADVILGGHTHWVHERMVNGIRAVNIGSVSNPWAEDLRASYVIIEADKSGYELTWQRVDYDRQAVIDQMHTVRYPKPRYLIGHLSGDFAFNQGETT